MGIVVLIALIVAAVILGGYLIGIYNQLVQVKVNVDKSWANIEVLEKQGFDEIPKLVKVCEGYMQYERETLQKVIEALVEVAYDVHRSSGVDFTVLGAVGVPTRPIDPRLIEVLPGVREVIRVSEPYKLAGRTFKPEDTVVDVGGVGFQVFVAPASIGSLGTPGEEIVLFTHLQVRENELTLYGFRTEEELATFRLVQTVPGIGENLGLTILHEIGDIERFPTVGDFAGGTRQVSREAVPIVLVEAIARAEPHESLAVLHDAHD